MDASLEGAEEHGTLCHLSFKLPWRCHSSCPILQSKQDECNDCVLCLLENGSAETPLSELCGWQDETVACNVQEQICGGARDEPIAAGAICHIQLIAV